MGAVAIRGGREMIGDIQYDNAISGAGNAAWVDNTQSASVVKDMDQLFPLRRNVDTVIRHCSELWQLWQLELG